MNLPPILAVYIAGALFCAPASGAVNMNQWTYTWTPSANATAPRVAICPLRYDKRWAYAVEIDDGPVTAYTVSAPLLSRYGYTDAPPGVAGGVKRPFVGGVAVMGLCVGGNSSFVDWDQLHKMTAQGWSALNHSYWHSGNDWEPQGALKPEEFERELYWSQQLLAARLGTGLSATHFVYPNGYMAYEPHIKAYGLQSGSRVAGKRCNLLADSPHLTDIDRNYLDEGVWAKSGNVMEGFPDKPRAGDLVIDFTHGMDPDTSSANNRRWVARLDKIAGLYGQAGDDSMWCAPTDEIVRYHVAARCARVDAKRGNITVYIPADVPGTALTLRIDGVPTATRLTPPAGGVLYRKGDTVWLTTPVIGKPGAKPPSPAVRCVYEGPVRDVKFDAPMAVACVRLRQGGPVKPDFTLNLQLVAPNTAPYTLISSRPADTWGRWLLLPLLPDRKAITATEVRVNADPSLDKMEVWAVK